MILQYKFGFFRFFSKFQSFMYVGSGEFSVDVSVLVLEQVAIGGFQVSVEEGIYKRVNERVCIVQLQKCSFYLQRDVIVGSVIDEGFGCREEEKRQLVYGEGFDDDFQGGGCFLFFFKDGDVFFFVFEQFRKVCIFFYFFLEFYYVVQGDDVFRFFQAREVGEFVFGGVFFGGFVNLVVYEKYDGYGDIKCYCGGVNRVVKILVD